MNTMDRTHIILSNFQDSQENSHFLKWISCIIIIIITNINYC